MSNGNGFAVPMDIPIVGAGREIGKAKVGAQMCGVARRLDGNGLFEVSVVAGPNGEKIPLSQRSDYMDAQELLEAIRLIVREEIERAAAETTG